MENEHEERWLPVAGYEGWYDVSDWGRFRRIKAYNTTFVGRILKTQKNHRGYSIVVFSKNGDCHAFSAHKIVARAFIGQRPDGMEINHKDGDKTNNFLENLEYVAHSDNVKHAYRIGIKSQEGESNNASKLTEVKVHEIRKMLKDGRSYVSIAPLFNVSVGAIGHIARGERWAWLKEEDDDERTQNNE